ncbi:MAG: AraC family transcriptional regulator [Flavobacteriaceae bacterium]|nr:AraC family transcriptional regulator [Flavobacteriaceae bacterium]|tara:strand:- start:49 stop:906 length:858 start_codon:yes stop_codon:yes gene_type:complete
MATFNTEIESGFNILKSVNEGSKKSYVKKEIDASYIQFHFVTSGKATFIFNNDAYKMEVENGKYIVLYNPMKSLPINAVISEKSCLISILISIKKFHKLFSEDSNNIQFLKDENINQKYYYENKISNPIFLVLNEIKRFDENSSTKNLFLKAKIYELFSHLYNRNRDLNIEQCPFLTNEENFKKIKRAKDIIIKNMTDPPSLVELSEEINLSLKKLKEGFKKIYGKPVYQFLIEYKMELAKKLLSENDYNVNEVSLKLGYSTASHFITAFKNKYGLTPKNFKKNY